MTIWNYILIAVLAVYALMVVASVYTVLFERRDPTRAFMWITVIVIFPVIGLLFFVFFGQNYRKRKIFKTRGLKNLRKLELLSQWQIKNLEHIEDDEILPHIDIVKLLLYNSKTPITVNNRLTILNNGEETFPAIFEALRAAKHHIHLEYYIIENDTLGEQLAEILCAKAREGVEVRLLYDDVGSWSLSPKYKWKLRKAGVQVKSFMPVVFPYLTSSVNYRNHRKIIVVDGEVGFMGGLNFADRYLHGTKRGVWRDIHLRIEGEGVRMLQITFMTDWFSTTKKEVSKSPLYFPNITKDYGKISCQFALSGPDSDYAVIMQGFFAAIARAKHYIYISTPYFLPGESLLTALKIAALSGVDVRILLPEDSDSRMVHWASRSYFTELLEAGLSVYLYTKGFNHSKIMVIDGTFGSIGSANMDARSFEDNFEVTAMIYNKTIAKEIEEDFLHDLEDSTLLTLEGWEGRKRKDNFKEAAARLFAPLL